MPQHFCTFKKFSFMNIQHNNECSEKKTEFHGTRDILKGIYRNNSDRTWQSKNWMKSSRNLRGGVMQVMLLLQHNVHKQNKCRKGMATLWPSVQTTVTVGPFQQQ